MAAIPHFALPFAFGVSHVRENEQDSREDVGACVEAVMRYRKGQRSTAPEFGIEDPVFAQAPLDASSFVTDITDQEPRAKVALVEVEDELDRARSYEEGVAIVRIAAGVENG